MISEVKGSRSKVQGAWFPCNAWKPVKAQDAKSRSFLRSPLYLVPSTLNLARQRGFTLLELTVVLFVVVLGFSVIGLNLSSGSDSTKIKAAARDIVSALRYARGQALMLRQETTLTMDLDDNSYTVSGKDKLYRIAEDIELTVVTAQTELTGNGSANIRFFADGSSTGGRIMLERAHAAWKIDINWLTGQIELENE